ncbi:MAG: ATP-binding protein [Streptosporangiaceae bacterium]|jgi:signal transduction histidine kinase
MPHIRWTIQLRLTLTYGILFFAAGAVLLGVTYALVARFGLVRIPPPPQPSVPKLGSGSLGLPEPQVTTDLALQRAAELRELLVSSSIALAAMTFISIGLGWLMARRALRPLRTMMIAMKDISEHNLDRRLNMEGPSDEIKGVADTFDGLLGRLGSAFEAQRRFVANASHELRTPLTLTRSLLEVTLADTEATRTDLRKVCYRILASNEQEERLIEALLTLARSQRGLDRRVEIDLAGVTSKQIEAARPFASSRGCRIETILSPAGTEGDLPLMERLISNLVDNAMRHNVADGWMRIETGNVDGRPTLRVTNSGPVIPAEQAETIFQPFQRLHTAQQEGDQDGLGVGLSIVAAIVTAHNAELRVVPREAGGLDIRIAFRPGPGRIPDSHTRRFAIATP